MDAVAGLGHFSGSVLVARRGMVLLKKAYGFADLETKRLNQPDTQFRIASLSKSFTAMAILVLRQKGLLGLDDPLSDFFPEGPGAWRNVRLRHMLGHTSGIPDYEILLNVQKMEDYSLWRAKPGNLAYVFEKALSSDLDFEPGSKYKYSNTGYLLLGHIVEMVSRESYGAFVERELVNRFGMANSGEDRYDLFLLNRAKPYLLKPERTDKEYFAGFAFDGGMLVEPPRMRMETPNGAGGMYSTAEDLFSWIQGLIQLAERDPDFEDVFRPGLKGYAMGWFVDERHGRKRIWHSGGLPGFISILEYYPEESAAIVLLGNTDQYSGPLAEDLAAILFGQSYPLPRRHRLIDLALAQLNPLIGQYRNGGGSIYTVSRDKGRLVIAQGDELSSAMLPESETSFFVPGFRDNVQVKKNTEGAVIGLIASISGKKETLTKEKVP